MNHSPAFDAVPPEEIPPMPPGTRLVTLDNGLVIIVREDHSAPVACAQAWCRSGSVHEERWMGAGLSHVLEHMLFKGTSTRPAGRIDQEVQDAGGYMNAYTSFDRTVYWINVPSTGTRVAIDILCDIMQNAVLPEDELEKEKQVIRREMDMNQDDPGRRASRRLFETAYTVSPYRFTIIGYPDIFGEVRREDIVAYYRGKYIPNNLFFVIAGDVNGAEVVARIREAFRGAKARALAPAVLAHEPRQTAPREIFEEAPVELGHVHFSWHIPDLRHPDIPALDVLSTLLGGGRSSRLHQEVREKQALVNSVSSWTYNPGHPGLFGISAVVNADKFEPARKSVLREVERLKNDLVTPDELSKVVKQFMAGVLATKKTMQGQAQDLGSNWLSTSDLSFSERYLAAVQRITRADLQRVARQYLAVENRTVYALLPEGTTVGQAERTLEIVEREIHKFELPNGLRLLVKEDHRLPFVEMRAVFKGGVLAESADKNGLAFLTTKMLLQGTPGRSSEQIANEVESAGGSINFFSANNSFGVNVELLSSDFERGLHLMADVLLNPLFPADAFERERQVQLAGLRAQRDQMLPSAARLLRRAMFGEQGYGLDSLGSEGPVQRLEAGDLRAFHRATTVPNNCVLAIFGDVHSARVKDIVQTTFADWKPSAPVLEKLPAIGPLCEIKHVTETRDKKQAVLLIGFPGVTVDSPDRFALDLLQEACSDLGSRLFLRIREKLGLAYYVGAQNLMGLLPGFFAFYVGTMPEKVELVESELLKEAELLRTEGLTEEELKRAKAKIIGQKKIERQDIGNLASVAALDELYGLGFNYSETEDAKLEAVTREQVRKVAAKYLREDAFVVAVVGPRENSAPGAPAQ
jgi:zinc protease